MFDSGVSMTGLPLNGQPTNWADVVVTGINAAATSFANYTRSQSPYAGGAFPYGAANSNCPPGYTQNYPGGACVPLPSYGASSIASSSLPLLLIGGLVLAVVLLRK